MAIYTVHVPDGAHVSDLEAIDRIVFIKDGFAWIALFAPLLWLLWQRMWMAFAAVLAVSAGIVVLGEKVPAFSDAAVLLLLALSVFVALEGNGWRRWSLSKKGYTAEGPVAGVNQAECEQRFFERWLNAGGQPKRQTAGSGQWPVSTDKQAITGLFPDKRT